MKSKIMCIENRLYFVESLTSFVKKNVSLLSLDTFFVLFFFSIDKYLCLCLVTFGSFLSFDSFLLCYQALSNKYNSSKYYYFLACSLSSCSDIGSRHYSSWEPPAECKNMLPRWDIMPNKSILNNTS